jgi:RNA polymerase sigma-70 factor, ECF subfamily
VALRKHARADPREPNRGPRRQSGVDDLDAWLNRSYPVAYRTACLVLRSTTDAEDAVQEAFLRVWRFRNAIPDGDGREPWLYRVVVNACLSRLRSDRNWRARTGDEVLSRLPSQADPQHDAEDAALADCMAQAVERLPEHLRVPVILRYYTGLTEREIAIAIQRRPGTVKSRLHDARRMLADDPSLAAWAELEVAR